MLLRRLRCQEDLSLKSFGPPSAGTIGAAGKGGGPSRPPPPPPQPPLLIHPPPPPPAGGGTAGGFSCRRGADFGGKISPLRKLRKVAKPPPPPLVQPAPCLLCDPLGLRSLWGVAHMALVGHMARRGAHVPLPTVPLSPANSVFSAEFLVLAAAILSICRINSRKTNSSLASDLLELHLSGIVSTRRNDRHPLATATENRERRDATVSGANPKPMRAPGSNNRRTYSALMPPSPLPQGVGGLSACARHVKRSYVPMFLRP